MLIPAPAPAPPLSSLHSLSSNYFLLPSHFFPPGARPLRRGDLAIRMGGGPRTFPGGVSKWQWKRMQAKKAQQLLKARLARERQLYEMRKRAELRDAVAHLERPWDPDSVSVSAADAAPNLLSVAADEQLRALADRFHRPGGVDIWNDRDGPRVFASPATGAASARFFPKNAVYSVQPYALHGAAGESGAPRPRRNAVDLVLGLGDGAQGVRENVAEEETYGTSERAPAVELVGKDGTWELVNALDGGDDGNAGDRSWNGDEFVTSESEGTGDVSSWRERRVMVGRNGRNNGVARWEVASAKAAGRDDGRGRTGDVFFSGSKGAREGHLEQRWQQRSSGRSTMKRAGERLNAFNTTVGSRATERGRTGGGSFSDTDVIRGGSEPKWRTKSKVGTLHSTGRSKPQYHGNVNAPRMDWISDGFDSNSDNARDGNLEPNWRARNNSNRSDNGRGRSKLRYGANTSDRERPGRYTRDNSGDERASGSSGDGRYLFGGGYAEDLEAPTWKPRRMNQARTNNGGKDDNMGLRSRRRCDGAAGAARRSPEIPRNTNTGDGRKMDRNPGQWFRGDNYSLRPTSELHSSWRETGSDEL